MRAIFERVLDRPWVYRLQTAVLAPGAEAAIVRAITAVVAAAPPARRVLDVGCGPQSWLTRVNMTPLGTDLSFPYLREYAQQGGTAVAASADWLPFATGSFDAVWSVGLLHHLPLPVAAAAVAEMVRVCRAGGYVAIFDAVLPESRWRRPLAYAIRRMDRGRFMRSEAALRAVLPPRVGWRCRRFTYARTGLEGLMCWARVFRPRDESV